MKQKRQSIALETMSIETDTRHISTLEYRRSTAEKVEEKKIN
jgi:hypothetical protein